MTNSPSEAARQHEFHFKAVEPNVGYYVVTAASRGAALEALVQGLHFSASFFETIYVTRIFPAEATAAPGGDGERKMNTTLNYDILTRRQELARLLKEMFGWEGTEWEVSFGPSFANLDRTPEVGDHVRVTIDLNRAPGGEPASAPNEASKGLMCGNENVDDVDGRKCIRIPGHFGDHRSITTFWANKVSEGSPASAAPSQESVDEPQR